MYHHVLDRAVALVVPPLCAGCTRFTDPGRWICADCQRALTEMAPGRLSESSAAAFPYEGVVRPLIAALKFRGAVAIARELADLMRPRLPNWLEDAEWIVPVPAHPARRRARGYNQSLLLARALARSTDAKVVDCLRRTQNTSPQSQLSRAKRLEFPRQAISIDERILRQHDRNSLVQIPTKVVLCDDVATTGVTLEVCAQAIREWHHPTGSSLV
ncbi:MAG: ComF family protein, partial [Solirubrobacterales bacterium]